MQVGIVGQGHLDDALHALGQRSTASTAASRGLADESTRQFRTHALPREQECAGAAVFVSLVPDQFGHVVQC